MAPRSSTQTETLVVEPDSKICDDNNRKRTEREIVWFNVYFMIVLQYTAFICYLTQTRGRGFGRGYVTSLEDLVLQLVFTDFGLIVRSKQLGPWDLLWWWWTASLHKMIFLNGRGTIVFTISTPKPMPTLTMPKTVSSSRTSDGCWLKSTLMSFRSENRSTWVICTTMELSCSNEGIFASLFHNTYNFNILFPIMRQN